jgi:hypothetical protein
MEEREGAILLFCPGHHTRQNKRITNNKRRMVILNKSYLNLLRALEGILKVNAHLYEPNASPRKQGGLEQKSAKKESTALEKAFLIFYLRLSHCFCMWIVMNLDEEYICTALLHFFKTIKTKATTSVEFAQRRRDACVALSRRLCTPSTSLHQTILLDRRLRLMRNLYGN